MAPTLRRVAAIVPLHLDVLAGREALDRPVRWVAVSELEDPTPFLEGGELVLTTGMRLTAGEALPYISRLVARGVAGLGFGVGLSHDVVPPAFVEAAAAAGLPLVEVPRDTPFIAIGKAVSELLAAEQYEEISRAFAAQGRLTRAALQPAGTGAVIERLAREIHGWALLFDDAGAVRQAADAAAVPEAAARFSHTGGAGGADGEPGHWAEVKAKSLRPELARLRRTPSLASLALSTPGEHVIVQPLGRRGFFAVGSERAFSPIGHTVVNAAGSLLTLALEQGRDQRAAATRVRAAVLRLLLAGETKAAMDTMAAMGGMLPDGPVTVLACETADADSLAEALPCFTAPWEGRGHEMVVALVPAERTDEITARAAEHGRVGVSAGVAIAVDLATALDQAERALATANPVARFAEMAGQGLLSLIDPAAAASFAAALLAPLREYGSRADLVESLRAYLASNGHWDAAAQRLGVHRHTLRYRMKRVSELLGRDLDDPAVRAELWIALCY
ncbi:PucR family transcriptional regulator [Planotetraspora sp. A-T 1434]|uniref:PucR family transcriptional regulator n=1 Tax=Planotetraspora sp. A-T 1434 TaxID=2979219 RepID=UPI0021C02325|nr:PucR family transcriptional regulator [Planotetraspora sp. A-T 1434]MCT9933943.1 PucR family transcriptional regulator [Planotetraspora sp. A-T 1434]